MRGSSPALAIAAPRSCLAPPRPTPRPTLRSIDLEVLCDVQRAPPRSTVPPPLPFRARPQGQRETPPAPHPDLDGALAASLADLSFFDTVATGAAFCLLAAMRVVPSLAGLALVRDATRGGYVVVYATGPRGFEVVRARCAEDDPSISAAIARAGPVTFEHGGGRALAPAVRHARFGDPWTVIVTPAFDEIRCVATLELVDPLDGPAPAEAARQALALIAARLAAFARQHPGEIGEVFAPEQLGLDD